MMNITLEQNERNRSPIQLVGTFCAYILMLLLGISFITSPLLLFILYKNYWLFFSVLLIPIGWRMTWAAFNALKKYMWLNRHLSAYKVNNEQLTYSEWDKDTHHLKKGTIPLDDIDYIVVANHALEDSYAYTQAGEADKTPKKVSPPIIYVIFTNKTEKNILSIPFYDNHAVDLWLTKFKKAQINLYYVAHALEQFNTKDKQKLFEDGDVLIPYDYHDYWKKEAYSLYKTWTSEKIELDEVENSQPKALPKKLPFSTWARIAIIFYLLYIATLYITVQLAEQGMVNAESPLPGFIIVFVFSTLYFLVFWKQIRWYDMIRFCIESFVITLLYSFIISKKSSIANEMYSSILASTFFSPFIVWIPYLIVKYITKKQFFLKLQTAKRR